MKFSDPQRTVNNKKAQDPYVLLVPLLKAFALPEIVERATQSLRRMIYNFNDDTHYAIVKYRIIPEDIYRCFILDDFKRSCEVLSSQESSAVNAFIM